MESVSMNDHINVRIDRDLKQSVVEIFNRLGISESDAIRMFFVQVNLYQGIPFDVKIPNSQTLAAFKESKNLNNLTSYNSSQELFDYLDI